MKNTTSDLEFTFDVDGYPTEASLATLTAWDIHDPLGWVEFARKGWRYGDDYFKVDQRNGRVRVDFSTGGWSGNEDIVGAMKANVVLWIITWQESRRGGHFVLLFKVKNADIEVAG